MSVFARGKMNLVMLKNQDYSTLYNTYLHRIKCKIPLTKYKIKENNHFYSYLFERYLHVSQYQVQNNISQKLSFTSFCHGTAVLLSLVSPKFLPKPHKNITYRVYNCYLVYSVDSYLIG